MKRLLCLVLVLCIFLPCATQTDTILSLANSQNPLALSIGSNGMSLSLGSDYYTLNQEGLWTTFAGTTKGIHYQEMLEVIPMLILNTELPQGYCDDAMYVFELLYEICCQVAECIEVRHGALLSKAYLPTNRSEDDSRHSEMWSLLLSDVTPAGSSDTVLRLTLKRNNHPLYDGELYFSHTQTRYCLTFPTVDGKSMEAAVEWNVTPRDYRTPTNCYWLSPQEVFCIIQ